MTLSLVLGIVGVSGQLVAARNPRLGWTISLLNQPLWVAFAVVTGQWGLLLLTPGYAAAAGLHLWRARKARLAGEAQSRAGETEG